MGVSGDGGLLDYRRIRRVYEVIGYLYWGILKNGGRWRCSFCVLPKEALKETYMAT